MSLRCDSLLLEAGENLGHAIGRDRLDEIVIDHDRRREPTRAEAFHFDHTVLAVRRRLAQLLAARVEPYSPGKVSLRLNVRMTNNNRYDANFWAASFRLSSNGTLIAPNSDLDELIAANSSKDAEIEFILPDSLATAGLQMGDVGEGKPSIPLVLK